MGRPDTPRSPLYKELAVGEIFHRWQELLAPEAKVSEPLQRIVEYDLSRSTRIGPRGGFPPFRDMESAFEGYFLRLRDVSRRTFRRDRRELRRQILPGVDKRPLSYQAVLHRDIEEDKVSTNSGLPDFGKRKREDIQAHAMALALNKKEWTLPYVLGLRTQVHGKTRFIFMSPMSTNLVEKSFLIPMMDEMRKQRLPQFAAWEGFSAVEKAFAEMRYRSYTNFVSTDFKGMDQTMGPSQMTDVGWFLSPFWQEGVRERFVGNMVRATSRPILVQMDKITTGSEHGLASGSGWTNFSESIFAAMLHYDLGTWPACSILGDDGTFASDVISPDMFVEASASLGLESSNEKMMTSTTSWKYLQRYFDVDYRSSSDCIPGVYPSVQALNACIYPERFHDPTKWSAEMESLRWIMILENCHRHPLFEQLVKFVQQGDKLKLLTSLKSDALLKLEKKASELVGFVPSYNQEHIDRGILDFETVKLLRG